MLLQQHVPFGTVLTVPGSPARNGTLHDNFRQLSGGRTTKVPLLIDGEQMVFESSAILQHLCLTRGWHQWYPGDSTASSVLSLVDAYLGWHAEGTRSVARLVQRLLRPDLDPLSDQDRAKALAVVEQLEKAWLSSSTFVATESAPTIADLLCYEELVQATTLGALTMVDYPNLQAWMTRMQALPYNDEAHAALTALAAADPALSLPKRLGVATNAGLEAWQQVQDSWEG